MSSGNENAEANTAFVYGSDEGINLSPNTRIGNPPQAMHDDSDYSSPGGYGPISGSVKPQASGRRQTNTRTPDHRRSDSDGSGYAADNSFESAGSSARGQGHVEGLRSTVALLERLLDEAKQQLKEQKAEAKAEAKAQLDEAKAEAKAQLDAVKAEARAQLERSLADKDEIIKLYKLQLGSMQEARNK
ncbi:hypothetical protein H0H87_003373 [Tephrocybe sp. NHM501043]|nr:hypothetical protein H0H87_003373 [Tephrocybe sp. NHM501043]